jgi:predicted metal-dependent enzyme (double-stranded beta helix superfamily)
MLLAANLQRHAPELPISRANPISALVADVAAACGEPLDAMGARIRAALARAVSDAGLLSPEQRAPKPGCYARHVLYSDPGGRFTILSIVWDRGQFSPAHAHHTWCAYAVLENALDETVYRFVPAAARAEVLRTEVRKPGYSCFAGAGLDQIHSLGNSGPRPAISIHVYGVERERIATHVNRLVDVAP